MIPLILAKEKEILYNVNMENKILTLNTFL